MDRRNFIKIMIAFFGSITLPIVGKQAADARGARGERGESFKFTPDDLLLDQSGTFGSNYLDKSIFAVGVLSGKDLASAADKIKKIRSNTRFKCNLSFSSRNRWKSEYAKKLIDYWIDESDLKIDVLVIRELENRKPEKPLEKMSRYVESVSQLVDMSKRDKDKKYRLVSQKHFSEERQRKYEQMLTKRNKGIKSFTKISENQSDLLQLLDLVVGSARASQEAVQIENKMKTDLLKYLGLKLKTKSLATPLRHPRCSVTIV